MPRFDELSLEEIDRVTEVLGAFVSDERKARIERVLAARTRELVIVLEDVASEHNSAAVFRTADALGLLEVHLVELRSPFSMSRRVSTGAHRWIDFRRHRDPVVAYQALRARGFSIWAAAVHGDAVPVDRLPIDRPVALVFGNELEGLSPAAIESADGRFRIPMHGFVESLNISVAAALSLYDVLSRRLAAGGKRGLLPDDEKRLRATWYASSVRGADQILARAGLRRPAISSEEIRFVDD